MRSQDMVFEGLKKGIQEWIEDAKADSDYNFEHGWDVDKNVGESDERSAEMYRVYEKMELLSIIDEDQFNILSDLINEAFSTVEDYIYNLYPDDEEDDDSKGATA